MEEIKQPAPVVAENHDDVGVQIAEIDDQVVIQFPVPVYGIGFEVDGARAIAAAILEKAQEIEDRKKS